MSTEQLVSTNEFYVYIYLDPRKPGHFTYGDLCFLYEPFYVGKGKNNRWRDHLTEAKRGVSYNMYKIRTILKIQKTLNIDPYVIFLRKGLKEDQANSYEVELISVIGRSNLHKGPLTNLTDGGEGISGYSRSQESIVKGIETKRVKGLLNHSNETRNKMSEYKRSRPEETSIASKKSAVTRRARYPEWCTQEQRDKMSAKYKGRKLPEVTKQKMQKYKESRTKEMIQQQVQKGLATKRSKGTLGKKVICEETGIIYSTIEEAAKAFGRSRAYLDDHLKRNSPFIHAVTKQEFHMKRFFD